METNIDLIEVGNDENSSGGSDDCPSDDNLPPIVLKHLIPHSKNNKKKTEKCNQKIKEQIISIFGLGHKQAKKSIAPKIKLKIKDFVKKEMQKTPLRKIYKTIKGPNNNINDNPLQTIGNKKETNKEDILDIIVLIDAWTQTEAIDFAKAR